MTCLVLDASPRAKGNSALLSQLALKDSQAVGATARLLTLRELDIKQCTGCLRCVFAGERCQLGDDMYGILEAVADAEWLVLIAPTYVTTIPATLKLVLDRFLLVPPYYEKVFGRSALTVAVASPIDWLDFQVPLLNMVALGFGFRILDTVVMYGAGPGEVFLDDEKVGRFRSALRMLLQGEQRESRNVVSSQCPVCFNHLMEWITGRNFRCAVCHVPAVLESDGYHFRAADLERHRWTPQAMRDHFENWIRKTKDLYRLRLREVMKKRRELLGKRHAGRPG